MAAKSRSRQEIERETLAFDLTERKWLLGVKVARAVALIVLIVAVIVIAALTGHWPFRGGLVP